MVMSPQGKAAWSYIWGCSVLMIVCGLLIASLVCSCVHCIHLLVTSPNRTGSHALLIQSPLPSRAIEPISRDMRPRWALVHTLRNLFSFAHHVLHKHWSRNTQDAEWSPAHAELWAVSLSACWVYKLHSSLSYDQCFPILLIDGCDVCRWVILYTLYDNLISWHFFSAVRPPWGHFYLFKRWPNLHFT